jgi:hypothetical protein
VEGIVIATELTKLPRTNFSGLDYDNIIEDIVHLVKDNPKYNKTWDDFLSSNAGRMLIELFSYIADQLATRIDWVVNENFIGTATQKKSIMRILTLLGYNFQLPIGANVEVEVSLDRPVGDFYITQIYANDGQLSPFSLIAKDLSGTVKNFECLDYDETNQRCEYKTGVKIESGTTSNPNLVHKLHFYEGTTKIETFTAETDNNPIFELTHSSVIHNSVRVYSIETTNGSTTEKELTKVNSFLDPDAQRDTDSFGEPIPLPYIIHVRDENRVSIEFGSTSLLSEENRRLRKGDQIRVFYRIGGGIDGNITRNSINQTSRLLVGAETVNLTFVNELEGVGGQDGETSENAITYAPLQIRTAEKLVTEDDYSITLNSDTTVLKAKAYGNNNMPPNLYTKYGVFIKPLEVWNYILKNKPGWTEIEPSKYNDFRWITLRLENRFNEIHTLRDGEFDYKITKKNADIQELQDIDYNDTGLPTTFKNFIWLEMPEKFKNNLYPGINPNDDIKLKFTVAQLSMQFFDALRPYNIFFEDETTNEGLIEGNTPVFRIYRPIHAEYRSSRNVSGNPNMETYNLSRFSLDNREAIEIDFIHGYQEFQQTSDPVDNSAGTYTFRINLDNGTHIDPRLQGISDVSVALNAAESLISIALKIKTAINTIETNVVNTYVNTASGKIRIYSMQKGDNSGNPSSVNITAPGSGTSIFTILIGVDTKIDNSVLDYTNVTPVEIRDIINLNFKEHNNYNNGVTGTKGMQQLGLTIVDSDDCGLDPETTYYFWVNEKEYLITTKADIQGDITIGSEWITDIDIPGDIDKIEIGMSLIGTGIPANTFVGYIDHTLLRIKMIDNFGVVVPATVTTLDTNIKLDRRYTDIKDAMQNALTIVVTGDIENGEDEATNVDVNFDIDQVETGMFVVGTGIAAGTFVGATNRPEQYFKLVDIGGAPILATQNVENNNLSLIKLEVTIVGGDIQIKNITENPVGTVRIEHGTSGFDLLTNLIGFGPTVDSPTMGSGSSGYQNFGLSVANNATAGYHGVGLSNKVLNSNTGLSTSTKYWFKADIDGAGVDEYDFTTDTINTTFTDVITKMNAAIGTVSGNPLSTYATFSLINGNLVCTSNTTGSSSSVLLENGITGDGITEFNLFDEVAPGPYFTGFTTLETEVIGLDAITDLGLASATLYDFKINSHIYSITTGAGTTSLTQLKDLINSVTDLAINYTTSIVGTSPNNDIRLTSNTNNFVLLEAGITNDLLTALSITPSLPIGGGDYSNIAKIVDVGIDDFIKIKSPSKGEDPSRIVWKTSTVSAKDVTYWIFGFNPGSEKTVWGYNRLTVITNGNLEDYGNCIFELGSLNFISSPKDFYANYLTNNNDFVYIGRYHYDNYETTNPSWREKASRIYNTVYDKNTLELDLANSEFHIRLTDKRTDKLSIFTIENDWTLAESEAAQVISAIGIDGIGVFNGSNYMIKLNIDSRGWVELDITGDNGVAGPITGYTLTMLVDNINVAMGGAIGYAGDPVYGSYNFAVIHEDGNKIIIKSPYNTNISKIQIGKPLAIEDATQAFFNLKELTNPADTYDYCVTGDYYLDYIIHGFVADFSLGSEWIENISDMSNVEVGMTVLKIVGVLDRCKILEIDTTNNKIKVSKSSYKTSLGENVRITWDLMTMHRITTGKTVSNLPDLNFYLHFVSDKRYVEGIFDGEEDRPGYPLGSLDEDIYKESIDDKKIVGLDHVFKETNISTFDIIGTIYYDKVYAKADIEQRVETSLEEAFSLENRNYAEPIARSKIMALIHDNDGVNYVELSFIGRNAEDAGTNVSNTIECNFDEILILSEKIYVGGEMIHGMKFTYTISNY